MNTPYFVLNEKDLLDNVSSFSTALSKLWPNSKIAYSIKTNSLPWMLEYLNSKNIMAEAVSYEEYRLAKLCGYKDQSIVFNGPIKTESQLEEAISNGAIINIDSKRELDYIASNRSVIKGKIGLRINIDPAIFPEGDAEYCEDGFRFGFADKDNLLADAISVLYKTYGNKRFGLHLHCNTITRSIEAYVAISKYAVSIIKKYNLDPEYIDIGGGFFGGVPGKPTADDYISAIRSVFEQSIDIDSTTLIIEPGSAFAGSIFDFCTSVLDVKDTLKSRIVTTDGSRINIDPLWIKSRYLYTIERHNQTAKIIPDQIICGYTCMDHDRIMRLKDDLELNVGDIITYHKVGNYTVTFGGMFIRYLPEVYLKKTDGSMELIRRRTSVDEYYRINSCY